MRLPSSLRSRQYRLYAAGNLFSLQGMWAQRTAVAWLAWELSGAASWVGLIAFLSFAPTLVSGPIFGVMADRVDLRRAATIVQTAMAASAAALCLALLAGVLSLEVLAALALAQGVAISAHHPTRMALTPRLAPKEALANAIAVSSLNFNIARLIGPAWGGYAIAHIGADWTLALCAALFLPILVILPRLTPREAEGEAQARTSIVRAITDGAAHVAATPAIRHAMALTAIFALVVRGALELLPVIADGVFQRGAAGLGEIMGAAGAGAILAAIYLASRDVVTEARPPRVTYAALFTGFAACALMPAVPVWGAALVLTAVAGCCGTLVGVSMQSVVQLALNDRRRGRVMSLWIMVGIGSASIGAILMGAAADLFGFGPTLTGASVVGAAISAAALAATGRRRVGAG